MTYSSLPPIWTVIAVLGPELAYAYTPVVNLGPFFKSVMAVVPCAFANIGPYTVVVLPDDVSTRNTPRFPLACALPTVISVNTNSVPSPDDIVYTAVADPDVDPAASCFVADTFTIFHHLDYNSTVVLVRSVRYPPSPNVTPTSTN